MSNINTKVRCYDAISVVFFVGIISAYRLTLKTTNISLDEVESMYNKFHSETREKANDNFIK